MSKDAVTARMSEDFQKATRRFPKLTWRGCHEVNESCEEREKNKDAKQPAVEGRPDLPLEKVQCRALSIHAVTKL